VVDGVVATAVEVNPTKIPTAAHTVTIASSAALPRLDDTAPYARRGGRTAITSSAPDVAAAPSGFSIRLPGHRLAWDAAAPAHVLPRPLRPTWAVSCAAPPRSPRLARTRNVDQLLMAPPGSPDELVEFENVTAVVQSGETMLRGLVIDQAALQGILQRLHLLGWILSRYDDGRIETGCSERRRHPGRTSGQLNRRRLCPRRTAPRRLGMGVGVAKRHRPLTVTLVMS